MIAANSASKPFHSGHLINSFTEFRFGARIQFQEWIKANWTGMRMEWVIHEMKPNQSFNLISVISFNNGNWMQIHEIKTDWIKIDLMASLLAGWLINAGFIPFLKFDSMSWIRIKEMNELKPAIDPASSRYVWIELSIWLNVCCCLLNWFIAPKHSQFKQTKHSFKWSSIKLICFNCLTCH